MDLPPNSNLEDSTEFIEDLSINIVESPNKLTNNVQHGKKNNIRTARVNKSKINLELQVILKKTKKKATIMSRKARASIIFHKLSLITMIMLNLVAGVMFQKKIEYADYVSYVVSGLLAILAVFNFQKQGLAQVGASGDLKKIVRRIDLALMETNTNSKTNNLFKIKRDLTRLDFIIFKADYGIDYDQKPV